MNAPILQNEFPISVQKVLVKARKELNPEAIILYGSRARNEGSPTSDFDFAIQGACDDLAWTNFCNYVFYEAPTLYHIDLVRYGNVSQELRDSIDSEGRMVE